MNNIDEIIKSILSEEQIPPLSCDFAIKRAINNLKIQKRSNLKSIKTFFATVCFSLLLFTGVVFANNIEHFIVEKFRLGKGIDTAVENGYIEDPKMDFIVSNSIANINEETFDNIDVKCKINDFLIDNYNLSVEFNIQFDDSINEIMNLENVYSIELLDLIVTDENNTIIFDGNNKESFEIFCEKNNLNYKYKEFSDNYINSGLNSFPRYQKKSNNNIILIYNMYSDKYPKSKKLNFSYQKIRITESDESGRIVSLIGDWNLSVDIPLKMIERSEEIYRVVSCENENFNVYTAKATDTGFELGIMISNVSKPEYPQELIDHKQEIYDNEGIITQRNNGIFTTDDFPEAYGEYYEIFKEYEIKNTPISTNGSRFLPSSEDTQGTYILNSNGEKFECTMNPGRKSVHEFLSNNTYNYYETFNMNKYTSTDNCDIFVDFYGKPVKIKLEKIKGN